LNPSHGEVYSIHHYVIKFVSELRQVGVFSGHSGFLHPWNWLPDITEILLKVALNTIKPSTIKPIIDYVSQANTKIYCEVW